MVEALPGSVRLKAAEALKQWQHWRVRPAAKPQVIGLLSGGRSNTSLKVSDGQSAWVLRVDGVDPKRLGISRTAEWRTLDHAATSGLAPAPVYFNPSLGVLICEFCEPDVEATQTIDSLATLLRAIHTLPPVKLRLDPLQRARRYLEALGERELPTALVEACNALEPRTPVLCHNDLLAANRLASGGQWLAIDWEYVAMGDPLFDLAVIIEGDGLTEDAAQALHSAWLGDAPDTGEQDRLAQQRIVYRELAGLWERAMGAR